MDTPIRPGDLVVVRTAFGNEAQKRAVTGVVKGSDFLIVRVCPPEEWDAAIRTGREPQSVPWPAEDVRLAELADA